MFERRTVGVAVVMVVAGCGGPAAQVEHAGAAHDAGAEVNADADANANANANANADADADADADAGMTASARVAPKADEAMEVRYGQTLAPGSYVFPDGFRLKVDEVGGCDFDTSVPCVAGTYRAHGVAGKREANVQWRTKTAVVLGHTIEMKAYRAFIVRK